MEDETKICRCGEIMRKITSSTGTYFVCSKCGETK